MSMYKLNPTFVSDFEVQPRIACYRVSSYHDSTTRTGKDCQETKSETDPRKDLEQKQQTLIERLKGQSEQLNRLLSAFGKPQVPTAAKPTPDKKRAEQRPEKSSAEPLNANKKDKDAKKEARKTAKAEAMKKTATVDKAASQSSKKTTHGTQWVVEDDRKTWETNLTLTVNIPPTLVAYEQQHLIEATLTVRDSDLVWVKLLSKIGEKREVAFEGEVTNHVIESKTKVKVVRGTVPSLQVGDALVNSLQTVWKLLGASLGLFSIRHQQVLSSAHQAIWLKKSEKILLGSGDLSYLTREASQFLARFDSLSSQWEFSIADIVLRSLLNLSESHPNNVETWAKKIDALVI